jgi:hypothetical protein
VLSAVLSAGTLTVRLAPQVQAGQHAAVLLTLMTPAPPGTQTDFALGTELTAPTDQLAVSTTGIPAGRYLVRVQIDRAESLPAFDPSTGQYDKPSVLVGTAG